MRATNVLIFLVFVFSVVENGHGLWWGFRCRPAIRQIRVRVQADLDNCQKVENGELETYTPDVDIERTKTKIKGIVRSYWFALFCRQSAKKVNGLIDELAACRDRLANPPKKDCQTELGGTCAFSDCNTIQGFVEEPTGMCPNDPPSDPPKICCVGAV